MANPACVPTAAKALRERIVTARATLVLSLATPRTTTMSTPVMTRPHAKPSAALPAASSALGGRALASPRAPERAAEWAAMDKKI